MWDKCVWVRVWKGQLNSEWMWQYCTSSVNGNSIVRNWGNGIILCGGRWRWRSDPITCCYLLLADFPSPPSLTVNCLHWISEKTTGEGVDAALLILDFCPFNHISTRRREGRRFGWPHYKNVSDRWWWVLESNIRLCHSIPLPHGRLLLLYCQARCPGNDRAQY